MAHRVLLGPSTVRAAGFPVRAPAGLSPEEQRLETWDELELEAFGWTLAERPEAELALERFSARTVWDVVEEIAETGLVEVMG